MCAAIKRNTHWASLGNLAPNRIRRRSGHGAGHWKALARHTLGDPRSPTTGSPCFWKPLLFISPCSFMTFLVLSRSVLRLFLSPLFLVRFLLDKSSFSVLSFECPLPARLHRYLSKHAFHDTQRTDTTSLCETRCRSGRRGMERCHDRSASLEMSPCADRRQIPATPRG